MKVLVLSNYAPKHGFKYPGFGCPIAHRKSAHQAICSMDRFLGLKASWEFFEVEKQSFRDLTERLNYKNYDLLLLSGSPFLVADEHDWVINLKFALNLYLAQQNNTPIVGVCFGMQVLADVMGGQIGSCNFKNKEVAMTLENGEVIPTRAYHENCIEAFHSDEVEILGRGPEGMPYLVKFDSGIYGIQSHPEYELSDLEENQKADVFWQEFFMHRILKKD